MPRQPHSHSWSADSTLPKVIVFRHPGYPTAAQPFIALPACDDADTLDHDTARIACALAACNRYDGYLTLDSAGQELVDPAQEQIEFREDGYFFHVPGDSEYPVYPSFRHWRPPKELPESWTEPIIEPISPSTASIAISKRSDVVFRDQTCRITHHVHGTEVAHIIPDGESDWYRASGMLSLEDDETTNCILLKADVHKLLDARIFTIIPRKHETGKRVWVTYMMRAVRQRQELVELYHDRQTQPLYGIKAEYLFCRFAWTILHFLDNFLKSGYDRWLTYRAQDQKEESRKVESWRCRDERFTLRGRSQSPTKRPRLDVPGQPRDDELEESERDGEGGWDSDKIDHEGDCRGRKRRRTNSPSAGSCTPSYSISSNASAATPISDYGLKDKRTVKPVSVSFKSSIDPTDIEVSPNLALRYIDELS